MMRHQQQAQARILLLLYMVVNVAKDKKSYIPFQLTIHSIHIYENHKLKPMTEIANNNEIEKNKPKTLSNGNVCRQKRITRPGGQCMYHDIQPNAFTYETK